MRLEAWIVVLTCKGNSCWHYPRRSFRTRLKSFLFDLEAGQAWRNDDLVPDNPNDPQTRRYVETEGFTQAGLVSLTVPPGEYEVYLSRGTEYELKALSLTLKYGEEQSITEVLERQIETPGYISAETFISMRLLL